MMHIKSVTLEDWVEGNNFHSCEQESRTKPLSQITYLCGQAAKGCPDLCVPTSVVRCELFTRGYPKPTCKTALYKATRCSNLWKSLRISVFETIPWLSPQRYVADYILLLCAITSTFVDGYVGIFMILHM